MTEILKVVGKEKFIIIKTPKEAWGSLGARRLTRKFAWVAGIIDTLQANSRMDWIILKLTDLLESTHLFYLYYHYDNMVSVWFPYLQILPLA